MLSAGGSPELYRGTLTRLAGLVERSEAVVPGHGAPHDRETALQLVGEDLAYLDDLERGDERPQLPDGRDTRRQRELHAENLRALAAS